MPWSNKKRGAKDGYFYKSVRTDGKPVKIYVGRGDNAHVAAALLERRKAVRQSERAARRAEMLRFAAAEDALRQFQTTLNLLTRASLLLAGYHEHHGEWRRRHVDQEEPRP